MLLTVDMENFKRGDRKIFESVYAYYYRPLLHFATSYISLEPAEEVVSEALFRLWQHRQKISNIRHLKSFLFLAVKNGCIDLVRTLGPKNQADLQNIDLATEEPNVLARIIYTELLQQVEEKMSSLSKTQQTVFRMSYLEGKSTEEIMHATNMSADSIFVQKSKAVSALRKAFKYHPLMAYFLTWLINNH